MSEYRRDYYLRHREQVLATQQRYYRRHRNEILTRRKGLPSQNLRLDPNDAPITKVGLPDARWGRKLGIRRPETKKAYMAIYDRLPERIARKKTVRDALGPRPRPGWTREMRSLALRTQEGRCAICRKKFVGPPCQDHDAATGKARGLLCTNCNHLLGKANDSVQTLRKAIAYLEKYA